MWHGVWWTGGRLLFCHGAMLKYDSKKTNMKKVIFCAVRFFERIPLYVQSC